MATRVIEPDIDVLTAAKQRIRNAFEYAPKLALSFSSGKDSLCLSSLVYDMIVAGEIDGSKLVIDFVDEEGLYPSMVEAAERWRKKWMSIGVEFRWFCLPVKQVCTLDSLSSSESWITWEPGQEEVWMRQPPPYAIVSSSILKYAGQMNYQTFLDILNQDRLSMVGLRIAESWTRRNSLTRMDMSKNSTGHFYPIYDWKDNDVWLYIKERGLEFPDIYMRLYEAGVKKPNLRLCAFFGDKTTQGLRWVAETDPELWERIERRMPNAYLALLYWDSEMFGRSTRNRKQMEAKLDEPEKDYKAMCLDLLFKNTDKYRINPDTRKWLHIWRRLYINVDGFATNKHYKEMYEQIIYGDPKGRSIRTLQTKIFGDFAHQTKRE